MNVEEKRENYENRQQSPTTQRKVTILTVEERRTLADKSPADPSLLSKDSDNRSSFKSLGERRRLDDKSPADPSLLSKDRDRRPSIEDIVQEKPNAF